MIRIEDTAALLVAAGLSTRFGPGNKLLERLDGRPLVTHKARLLAGLPFHARIAVTADDDVADLLTGFERVRNPDPARGQDSSIRIGLEAASASAASAVLVCLGDMPFISAEHLRKLARAADEATLAISWSGAWDSPPLLLPRRLAAKLRTDPESRVRDLLAREAAVRVEAPPSMLRDFDTRDDFADAAARRAPAIRRRSEGSNDDTT
ncbi:nucleotidyltransferase family protein [Sphingosinicella terrae]|uniref:nucleotidyltransferase family protein n=1 Tax=Sphingosinicella terrae TaxID=2172047 RepID=UPI000E0D5940|nr:NTP transferase domain-containing protein [Sphingosinicella terrae]